MAVELRSPFSWCTVGGDTAAMLAELQPNILKGHARDHLTLLFLRFDEAAAARAFVRGLVVARTGRPLMKSAMTHLEEIAAFKASGRPGTPYVGFGLTAAGYAALGIAATKRPRDWSFLSGMQRASLGDPPPARWESHLRAGVHAVVLVGDATRASRDAALARVRALIRTTRVSILGEEWGQGMRNANGECIEHFGYVDGRSQPLFLKEDIGEETGRTDGAAVWNPAFGAGRAIVPDRAAPLPRIHFGSYLVFRKLEQNVRLFMRERAALARRLQMSSVDAARAGAMIIGRFEDGTPLVLQRAAGMNRPVPNDFTYDSDPDGAKCPLFAHMRKVNPRGSGSLSSEARERRHLMARRAQTYGVRTDDLHDGKVSTKPSGGVGLLFMAFNASIAEQFEFVQQAWANNPWFPVVGPGDRPPGRDPLAGQGRRPPLTCPLTWGTGQDHPTPTKTVPAIAQVVAMKGGDYFFMPSLAFLRSV